MYLLKIAVYIVLAGLYFALLHWVLEWLTHRITSKSNRAIPNARYLDSLYSDEPPTDSDNPDPKA